MIPSEPKVAYIMMEAEDIISRCFSQFADQTDYHKAAQLARRGTMPKSELIRIYGNVILMDKKNLENRFNPNRRIYIDSWSELLNLGAVTHFYNLLTPEQHYLACVGVESSYKESSLREKYLGDGAIAPHN